MLLVDSKKAFILNILILSNCLPSGRVLSQAKLSKIGLFGRPEASDIPHEAVAIKRQMLHVKHSDDLCNPSNQFLAVGQFWAAVS